MLPLLEPATDVARRKFRKVEAFRWTASHDMNFQLNGNGVIPLGVADLKLPAERFRDHTDVHNLCDDMIAGDRKRNLLRANVDRIWNGNAVYSRDWLKKKNQSWRARVNYRGLKGMTSLVETAMYNLDVEVREMIHVGIDLGSPNDRRKWEKSIATNITRMYMQNWLDSDFHIQRRIHENVLHGMGYHLCNVKGQWIPRTPPSGCIIFPQDTPLNFHEDGEYFLARDCRTGVQIYNFIRNEKAAKAMGWNPDAVWRLLSELTKSDRQKADPQQTMREYNDGDIGASRKSQRAWLNYMYVKEFDDDGSKPGISLYIVAERHNVGDYLFRHRYYLEDWPLFLFPYEVGNGAIDSVRGLGEQIKDYSELDNRIKNAMADRVLTGSTIPVMQKGTIDREALKLMRVGLFSIIPQGLEPAQWNWPDLNQGPLAFSRELKQEMLANNQTAIPQEPERSDRQTGMEYMSRSQNISQVASGRSNFYYRNLTRFYAHILKTACKNTTGNSQSAILSKQFMDACARDGVPKEAFDHIVELDAERSVGRGSAASRQQALTALFQFVYPKAPREKQINLEQDYAASVTSYQQADQYACSHEDANIPNSEDSLIALENQTMEQGGHALAGDGQDHVRHLNGHTGDAEQLQQQCEQNGEQDAEKCFHALISFVAHNQQHLQFLQGSKLNEQDVNEFEQRTNLIAQYAKHLGAIIQSQQDQTPPQQQMSEDGQIKTAKLHMDSQLKTAKLQSDEQRKNAALASDIQRKDRATSADILLKANAHRTDVGLKTATTRADIGLKVAKSRTNPA
jgi:hypothetical protein